MSDHTVALPEHQPEPHSESPSGRGRSSRGVIAVIGSVVAVVLIAGGGFAAWQFFFASGTRPAEVLPASTFALVTVDLDPSGGQKIEAIKTLRKFPSWKERTGITPDSDVVKAIFEEAVQDGPCASLDYEKDVKPWIGQRAGLGGVLLGEKPRPVLALQVKDADQAKAGFTKLADCSEVSDDDDFGWAISDDYLLVSDSDANAKAILAAGKKSPLAEDADFQKWTEEVGGPGIVNAYLGSKGVKILIDDLGADLEGLTGGGLAGAQMDNVSSSDDSKELKELFKDFKGAAAGLKFNDGGIELSFAGGGAASKNDRTVGRHVGALPEDTAALLALAVPAKGIQQLESSSGQELLDLGEMFTEGTGITLPDDLITLLGDSLSLSVGGDVPADLAASDPSELPLGLLVHGDDAEIKAVVAKVEAATGATLADLPATLASSDGKVAVSTQPGYADDLLASGSLADAKDFKDVVSHADDAQFVFYLSLQNKWADALSDLAAEEKDEDVDEVIANVRALRAMGISAWSEGDTSRGLIRISVK
jgi:hypothetical protein